MNMNCNQINSRIDQLSMLVYSQVYQTELTGKVVLISPVQHKLSSVKDAAVYDEEGRKVIVDIKIYDELSVQVNSNVPLDGHTIIIY